MSSQHHDIWELAAWGFDHPVDRGSLGQSLLQNAEADAHRLVSTRMPYAANSPVCAEQTRRLAGALAIRKDTVALSGEFADLEWELSVVDLRKLIAFQRRIGFTYPDSCPIHRGASAQQLLNLALPLYASSKSPYMEAVSFRGRWFLRDGYHRSYRLLKHSVHLVPCVVVYAESLAQMGAIGSRFFSQDVLFSEQPPMVTDFLIEETTVRYRRALPQQFVPSAIQHLQEPVAAGQRSQEAP